MIYSWRSKKSNPQAHIDLFIHKKYMVINLCEIKYSNLEFQITKECEQNLKNKMEALRVEMKPKEQLVLTMISFNSIKENAYSNIINKNIRG